jgi:glutamate dehydrogenase/leucine dehydrogenase
MDSQNSLDQNALAQIDRVRPILADFVTDEVLATLRFPEHVAEASLAIQRDDGSLATYRAYRSRHSTARGPAKGGIRFHQMVSREEAIALSMWMSLKTAVLDLPLGGGKGGIVVDPKSLSKRELERLSRAYVRAFRHDLGPNLDVPAPDVNTNGEIMAWMTDEYEKLAGQSAPGTFTGKPLSIGGSLGRDRATALGGFIALERYFERIGESMAGKTAAIQGSGNAGLIMAGLLSAAGVRVVAVSDSREAISFDTGLDIAAVSGLKSARGPLSSYPGARTLSNEALLELPVDILVPAAVENQIRSDNADRIVARLVVELANGPTTPEADASLAARGIRVIPDILANAGGVTVSYFEQVQNAMNYYWTREEAETRLRDRMIASFDAVYDRATAAGVPMRDAAVAIALERIARAKIDRGFGG